MSYYQYSTISSNGSTFALSTSDANSIQQAPAGLIATNAVQLSKGWIGQVLIDKEIVFETKPKRSSDAAIGEANRKVVETIKKLFGWTPPSGDEDA